jgi:hypothetical protein
MRDDPWHDLALPTSSTAISARRVNENNPWDVFWAIDPDGQCLLVLLHAETVCPRQTLPRLREIEVRVETTSGSRPMLVLRLLDRGMRDVFRILCTDIADAVTRCTSEAEAVDTAVARTWRWHHLLRGGAGGRLRAEEQKGLLGELIVLEHYMLPFLGAAAAVTAWRGPVGAAKDFIIRAVAVESKACSASGVGAVSISSEFQLADEDLEKLFLHVCALDPATPGNDGAFTLSEVAARLRTKVSSAGEAVLGRYDALLAAAGFRFEDDYSDSVWIGGERSVYHVSGEFPRMTKANLPTAVSNIRYVLSLAAADAFAVAPAELRATLAGVTR